MLSLELSLQKSQILSEKRYLFWNFRDPRIVDFDQTDIYTKLEIRISRGLNYRRLIHL